MRKEKGITLIALVITIIVLLILAGVTIVTLTGDNGLLQKAQTAKEENVEAKELELIKLAVSAAQVAGEGKLNTTNLKNELEKNLNDNDIENNLKPISDYWNYKEYKIDNEGNVEKYDKLLPAEYQQVEYIESSGTQYIDTKINPSEKSSVELKGCFTVFNSNSIFGSNPFFVITSSSHNKAYAIRYNNILSYTTINALNIETLFMNKDGTYFNSEKIVSFSDCQFQSEYSALLFGRHNSSGGLEELSSSRIYYCKMYEDNILLRNYIPCKSTTTVTNADGVQVLANTKGMYDLVEGKFYTNQGTGTFGYGMEDGTYVAPTNN